MHKLIKIASVTSRYLIRNIYRDDLLDPRTDK